MNAIEEVSTQAARTMRRRGAGISRPNSRGYGSAFITPPPHGSLNGCATVASTTGRSSQNYYHNRLSRVRLRGTQRAQCVSVEQFAVYS
jgi:hypothetical protein